MPKDIALTRAQRLSHIAYLLYRHPQGLTAAQLAELCGVSSRTIQRDLRDLEDLDIPLWDSEDYPPHYAILDGYYLPPIHLTLDDALALYLAARLLTRHADTYDPHVIDALAKLSAILPGTLAAPVQAAAGTLLDRPRKEEFTRVLNVLSLGWATQRKVRVRYQAADSDEAHTFTLCPYAIEPSSWGSATYVIGHADYVDAVRTYKVERVLSADLLPESFEVPEGFDAHALLEHCWGIMYGDEVEEVVLRFAPSASRRIKENLWHPSQCLEDLPDGGCVLRLTLSHPEEMVYWIRGWGPQVEVLAPEGIRERVAREAGDVVQLYGQKEA
ncbi:MAG: helix-turn-helix transcriptional regulator [Anaerolineae bacterium]